MAVTARSRAWAGFRQGQKMAFVWGAARDLPDLSGLQRLKVHHVLRQRWLNSFHLAPDTMEEFASRMIRWKPRCIIGYSTGLYVFARFLRDRGMDRIRPVATVTTAEKLWDHQRELIEEVFRCKVFDAYGGRDVGNIAFECEQHMGLHVLEDNVYLELLSEGGPAQAGAAGEVVVTRLTNYAMPLIRYRNGDLAIASERECKCGRPFALLSEVVGRSNDVIVTPRGGVVHAAFFSWILYGVVDEVRQFQVRQPAMEQVEVVLRCERELPQETLDGLRQAVARNLGPEVEVTVRCVDEIEPTSTGKHRYVISECGRR
jgi:phenylacetate-CoA ligase